mmetsp:Transcript_15650/g.13696  ORF Transcript_15650/g.13696 Transcript_15650/m.13696 type:complete len:104 (-) Transcript_15650:446-757(-)
MTRAKTFMNNSKFSNVSPFTTKNIKQKRKIKTMSKLDKNSKQHTANPSRASTRPESRLAGGEKFAKDYNQSPFDFILNESKAKPMASNIASLARVSCLPHTKN